LGLREQLGVESGRIVFLLFGEISERKGVFELLHACRLLSQRTAGRIAVLLVGSINQVIYSRLMIEIDDVSKNSSVQIIMEDNFVQEAEIWDYFDACDIALAIYQRHVGMSGILLRSAAAGKPVLSSNYGLLGQQVRSNFLGMTIDSSKPEEIARGMSKIVTSNQVPGFDTDSARYFASKNTPEAFGRTLYDAISADG
jgi:glycosyltransferase involved in cell wall biosynthesis